MLELVAAFVFLVRHWLNLRGERRRLVRPGDDRHRLMRLNGKYIQCLPGRGRKFFTSRV